MLSDVERFEKFWEETRLWVWRGVTDPYWFKEMYADFIALFFLEKDPIYFFDGDEENTFVGVSIITCLCCGTNPQIEYKLFFKLSIFFF